jgi:hypothetical protein
MYIVISLPYSDRLKKSYFNLTINMNMLFLYKHIKNYKKTVKICREEKNLHKTHHMWYNLKHSGTQNSNTASFLSLYMAEFLVQHTYSINYRLHDCKQLIVLGYFFNSATIRPQMAAPSRGV